jgi:hypothetical protein
MSNFQTAIIDADFIKYMAAACGEKRSVIVTNVHTGEELTFKNRTEFYGRGKNKNGGWLGDYNLAKNTELSYTDFTIQDVQTKLDFSNCTNVVDYQIKQGLAGIGTSKYKAFIGRGDSFRVERSTLLKYKGQRTNLLKPLYLKDVEEYLIDKYNAEIVTVIENDDRCVMECYKQPNNILLAAEKDFYSCPVKYYNAATKVGTINCDKFGKLSLNEKKEVKGYGRLHLYYQTCAQDDSDNYKAHCMSDVAWGEQSAYKALVGCKNDKEAWEAIEGVFKHLYPEPKEVAGWRGDTILIDWAYVLNECFDMARMLRYDGDRVVATDVLNSFK